ncbi:MAG: putative phage abortive infection protein [Muribaculaceae bacterium]
MNQDKNPNRYTYYFIVAGVIVVVVWLLFWLVLDVRIGSHEERGTFGDKFGAVNALFAGLAFAGLIVTMIMQREELGMQRQELMQTRDELAKQRQEFEQQNKTLKYQRFESSFFTLLTSFREIAMSLSYKAKDSAEDVFIEGNGLEIFEGYYKSKVADWYGDDGRKVYGIKGLVERYGIDNYEKMPDIHLFDHYFRFLYRLLKYVRNSDLIEYKDRHAYGALVRAALSEYELILILYNGLSKSGEKLKPLLEYFSILKNVNKKLIVNKLDVKKRYKGEAFDYTL